MGKNQYPRMITMNGNLSEEGQQVIAHFESVIDGVRGGMQKVNDLNKLSGHYQQYYRDVKAIGQQTPLQFAEDYEKGLMLAGWRDMVSLKESEDQKETIEKTASGQTSLEEALAELQEELKSQKKLMTGLKSQNTKLTNKINKLTEDDTEEEDDKTLDIDGDNKEDKDDKSESDD